MGYLLLLQLRLTFRPYTLPLLQRLLTLLLVVLPLLLPPLLMLLPELLFVVPLLFGSGRSFKHSCLHQLRAGHQLHLLLLLTVSRTAGPC
jgi:hypothetical protein